MTSFILKYRLQCPIFRARDGERGRERKEHRNPIVQTHRILPTRRSALRARICADQLIDYRIGARILARPPSHSIPTSPVPVLAGEVTVGANPFGIAYVP